ncbi:MAG: alpha-glucan family phosphorylase [Bacteroidales bacterium]
MPIGYITNGIHIPSWISGDLASLLNRYLGRGWAEDPDNIKIWEKIESIPDPELWRTHERRRERLISFVRKRLEEQLIRQGAKRIEIQNAKEVLHPGALTIGFARRFATYKRGDLILKDPSRLEKILNNPQKPVQIIFAGKAHPQDTAGKEIIKNIFHLSKLPEFRHKMVFIEDYDLNIARYLVQGVDVWLNTPLRPLEACGTSGMKAAANGALNLSILDGWWAEGYQPGLGWAIGEGEEYDDIEYQSTVESKAIYNLLETTIVPLFYERGKDNLPREWVRKMKQSMKNLVAQFNSNRMLEDYVNNFYLPSSILWTKIRENQWDVITQFVIWKNYIKLNWERLKILEKKVEPSKEVKKGETLKIEVVIELGNLLPQDISVEVYYGPVDSKANLLDRFTQRLSHFIKDGEKTIYRGEILCERVGRFGFRIRILPFHQLLINPYSMGLILWG